MRNHIVLAIGSIMAWSLIALSTPAAAAQNDQVDRSQRSRIQAERREAQVRFDLQMAGCSKQFAASACQDKARSERRATLEALRHQQLVLDDAQRRERAAARLRSIDKKSASQSAARAESAAAAQSLREPAASPASSARHGRPARSLPERPPAHTSTGATTKYVEPKVAVSPAQAEQRKQLFERRVTENERHRLEVAQRNAERDRKRPPAAALPVPSKVPASAAWHGRTD